MTAENTAWSEHQRKRFMRPDAHRYVRPDAERWMSAGARQSLIARTRSVTTSPLAAARSALSIDVETDAAERNELLRLRRALAGLKFRLALRRFARKYDPNQPRVPAGNPDGGQWTNGFAVAGMPRIPGRRPPTGPERTKIAKELAIWLGEMGFAAAEFIAPTSWLYYAIPNIVSYFDAPRSLQELQEAASEPMAGYDIHHVVERTSAAEAGYSSRRINAPENLVRIPRMKHWEINGWYQRSNDRFGGQTPREYLRHRDWDERERVGLDALRQFGVLKP